jgi:hypothetical protein
MSPEELTCRLNNLYTAAEVVDAIDDPELQRRRGWDLSRWRYDLIPWGVRFIYNDPVSSSKAEIQALMAVEARPAPGTGEGKRGPGAAKVVRQN